MTNRYPYRQIHLDFHNSEAMSSIGHAFDPSSYVQRLQAAHVDSVVTFAKCHHGWSYYDTRVGARHPGLSFDLLQRQFEACKAASIQVPIYVSVGWDERAARRHPEWRQIQPDGTFRTLGALGKNLQATWSYMCLNTPYLDELCAQIEELALRFPSADGFWFDITSQAECCCAVCRSDMDAQGLDWTSGADRKRFRSRVETTYLQRAVAAARKVNPQMPVFHNMGHVRRGDRSFLSHFSHADVESLPTGGWGYDHGPLTARYIDPLGLPQAGLTGKFHTVWGEFGGYKHPDALRYECANMLAHGQRCCVGDQLDPSGELDAATYRLIEPAFAEVKAREPWTEGSRPVAEIGLLSSLAIRAGHGELQQRDCPEDDGAVRMLLEGHHAFDVLDRDSDFAAYRLLILPDRVRLDPGLAAKLEAYRDQGGALLLSGESGLAIDAPRFAIDVGAALTGQVPFEPTFVQADADLQPDFCDRPVVFYGPALQLQLTSGGSRGALYAPWFNRSPRQFHGHQHTPPRPEALSAPAIAEGQRCIVFAHAVFSLYKQLGAVAHKQVVLKAISHLLGHDVAIRSNLPSTARVTLRRRPDGSHLLHLLHATPALRGQTVLGPLEVIEDLPVTVDTDVSIRHAGRVRRVMTLPQQEVIPFTQVGSRVEFTVGRFSGHQLVLIE